ncbi:putative N-acylglucosamine 2-epimerase [Paratrimastix pyriformis]|uniref:N-acylglucosamine 2-epimerase n=1 Tax=Paratrimastix pyriformis TaxID=342808 RepID=A0ABQ8UMJ9_9EUKA|nr:putative N-acylglucosamine 2-epimerase [Paratrimastix pyriformis]|eukprot:GAFH01001641.1.p2 GENE.GAFH01001641.1~~GAFH01001641.1.p2  ORF type:complete len:431 (+),score=159.21 GAFH01001641.1:20-1312(+)
MQQEHVPPPTAAPLTKEKATELAAMFKQELESVVQFWIQHSPDREHGGFFTCLERDGSVYDKDKFVWLQNREIWLMSELYNHYEKRPVFLEMATLGANFMKEHGRAESGDWYFALNQQGRPLVAPYNIFSDCFACMAFSAYANATQQQWAREIAAEAYSHILARQENPKGKWSKGVPGTRPSRALALPMILVNLCMELTSHLTECHVPGDEQVAQRFGLSPAQTQAKIASLLEMLFRDFVDPQSHLMHEHIMQTPEDQDTYDGRLVNPGHTLETCWFTVEAAKTLEGPEYAAVRSRAIEQACELALNTLRFGWDSQNGGIFYFMDMKGHSPQQLEWDQKLWWVHVEALIACIVCFRETRRPVFWDWYQRIHQYTFSHFPDPQGGGEWFGYLNREGRPLLSAKGGKWKGCFHVPRGMFRLANIFSDFAKSL